MPRFNDLLKIRLEEMIKARSEDLGSGLAQDIADYKDRVGYIRGLKAALQVAQELAGDE